MILLFLNSTASIIPSVEFSIRSVFRCGFNKSVSVSIHQVQYQTNVATRWLNVNALTFGTRALGYDSVQIECSVANGSPPEQLFERSCVAQV